MSVVRNGERQSLELNELAREDGRSGIGHAKCLGV